ncbi:MAG TPA: hypothetical protein VK850_13185, partial [Candidatus Binatia bacterium]|nr:hypothetical protein [Candidatus Binatia bacterium]
TREAFDATWQAAHADGLSDAHLKQLQEAWTGHDFLKPLRRALEMEHVMTSHEYRRMRNSETSVYDWLDGGSSAPPRPLITTGPVDYVLDAIEKTPQFCRNQVFSPIWKFAWSYQDELRFVRTVERGLQAWDAAIAQQSAAPLQSLGSAAYRYLFDTGGPVEPMTICYLLSPRAGRFFPVMKKAFVTQTLRELAIAGLALRRYELRYGKPAPSLEALVPEFLPCAPRDFMNGKALKYELRNGVMTLYSGALDPAGDAGDLKNLIWPNPASLEENENTQQKH